MNKKVYTLITLAATLVLATACGNQAATSTSSSQSTTSQSSTQAKTTNVSTNDANSTVYGKYADTDLETAYDENTATNIALNSEKTTVDGDGATVKDQTVTITAAGTYVLKGTLANGQVLINAPKDATVRIILNGVTITNSSSSAIYVQQADKVITTLAEKTTNQLTDGKSYTLAEGETEPDATFFSKEDLTINGSGTLEITGNYSNGIRSKDDLVLVSGTYKITAKNNAIKGKDSVSIKDGTYTLTTTEGDGIQASNSTEAEKGWIGIDGGTFTIQSGRDGLQAETTLKIATAKMTIKTADGYNSQSVDSENESYKGLKASGSIIVDAGTYEIDSADDGIHSNAEITINNGTFKIASGDDGIHADNELTLNDGKISITHSYEGLEAAVINIKGGTHEVVSEDDGINAGGGSDTETTTNNQFGGDNFQGGGPGGGDEADDSKQINITGGTTYVDAEGDGIDSNGNVTMSSGTLIVNGPVNGGNGALDYNGDFNITGGTLIASGSSGMAMTVSDTSTQAALDVYFDSNQAADTLVNVQTSDGTTIASFQPKKEFTHFVISSPTLKTGETVKVSTGGKDSGTAAATVYTGGSYSDGTELTSVKLDNVITSISQSGEAVTGNQMGGGPGGGRF